MLKDLLPLIPFHNLYTESFCGGAALYFAKPLSNSEVINDKNSEVINFYRVLKNDFDNLQKLVFCTLHSRELHNKALTIYRNPKDYSDVERAWAFWLCCTQSYLGSIGKGWSYQLEYFDSG